MNYNYPSIFYVGIQNLAENGVFKSKIRRGSRWCHPCARPSNRSQVRPSFWGCRKRTIISNIFSTVLLQFFPNSASPDHIFFTYGPNRSYGYISAAKTPTRSERLQKVTFCACFNTLGPQFRNRCPEVCGKVKQCYAFCARISSSSGPGAPVVADESRSITNGTITKR